MTDTTTTPPPEQQPPRQPAGTGSDAVDAGQARDKIESAAKAVFTAALIWYAVHGDEEPNFRGTSLLVRTAARLAATTLRVLAGLSASPVPKMTAEEQSEWVDKQTRQIVKGAINDAAAHYDTVFKRRRRADPHVSDAVIKAEYTTDTAWSEAAARSMATRLAAETAIGMQPDVEKLTGEPHHLMWISRGDPKVRALHRDLHGRVRAPGSPFHTWPDGQTLNYPGDPTAPIDAWINCRCALLLVPKKDAKQAEEIFHVPDADFDVPMAASARTPERMQAEQDLRAEKRRIAR